MAGEALPCKGKQAAIALRLPSGGAGPLSSPGLLRDHETERQAAGQLEAWTVPSLAFAPAEALHLLTGLPESPSPGISLGASVCYWAEVAKLSLELLAQELFMPDIEEDSSREVRAIWRPVLGEGDVPERLRLLASGMPPVCRALDGDEGQCRPALLINSFLKATVDAAVRHALRGHSLLPSPKRRQPWLKTLAERWLSSLVSEEPHIVAPAGGIPKFIKEVRGWVGRLLPAGGEAAFRTCLRLEPPPFWKGRGNILDTLGQAYGVVSAEALRLAYGGEGSDGSQ